MASYVFDLESNGFLEEATVIHSLVLKDLESGKVFSYRQHSEPTDFNVADGIQALAMADLILGHNVIKFDIPLIKKLYPWFTIDETKVRDTLVCTRLIWPDMAERDAKAKRALGKLTGSHSLKAWGLRLGNHKGDYEGGWESWNQEMQDYCVQDVEVTAALWAKIVAKEYSPQAIDLEHKVAWIVAQQERNGFLFDQPKASKLYGMLAGKRAELETKLQETFAPWWSAVEEKVPAKTLNYKDPLKPSRTAGAPYTEITYNLFNPGSRHHIANRLAAMRGWKPTDFTDKGQPKIDEVVLGKLPYTEAKLLAEYLMVGKLIGQMSEGPQAWFKQVKADGRIHGSVNTNGAVTSRATHSHPNMAQVPGVGKPFGAECRELFCVPPGKKLVGIDVSGLQLRLLGHFMARYDDGAYAREVVDGDIHTANQVAAGIATRNQAKTFIYAFIFGAGDEKIAKIIGGKSRKDGKRTKDNFFKRIPALKRVVDAVTSVAEKRGYIIGLDGRHIPIRSAHSALASLLQGGDGVFCKAWLVRLHELLRETGLDQHVRQVVWVHDETQLEVDEEHAETVGKLAVQAIEDVGRAFNMRIPMTGEYKIGNNWKETH